MANDRDKSGRFTAGHSAYRSGGRKRRTQEEEIKTALAQAKPRPDVLKKLGEAIERRESWAISLYLAYDWGRPVERHEVSGAGGDPLAILIDTTGLHPLDR